MNDRVIFHVHVRKRFDAKNTGKILELYVNDHDGVGLKKLVLHGNACRGLVYQWLESNRCSTRDKLDGVNGNLTFMKN